jgi:tetratricopeptide (TPR) repeat protein
MALVLLAAIPMGCSILPGSSTEDASAKHVHPSPPQRVMPPGAGAPLFGDLGDHHRTISTTSDLAQRYFDQGLVLTYGFNHAEAVRAFREASRLDPKCTMCFWGEAYALGPNINAPMEPDAVPPAWAALQNARRAAPDAPGVERDLVEALAKRYAETPPKNRAPLDVAYADAMRAVAKSHPHDDDVQTLFAEAVMDTMPWDYYQADGAPKAATREVVATLERVLDRAPMHPGAIHLHIHAVEASSTPGRAEGPADRLRGLVPGAGHLVHMPAHIYLRVGRYHDAATVNEDAAAADESYITQCRAQGFYPAAYYPHNVHFLWAAASFEGRRAVALAAADKLVALIPPEAPDEMPFVEEFLAIDLYARVRFGRWEDLLARPKPAEKRHYVTGVWHYARGMALAATNRPDDAAAEERALRAIAGRDDMAALEFMSFSTPKQLLDIADQVLLGRIAAARGDWTAAIRHYERGVAGQDALRYTEPPPWYFPVREALGDALIGAGRPADAERVFRAQLEKTPRNGWSLFGLGASLVAQGKAAEAEAVAADFDDAWQLADVTLPAATF